VTALLVRLIRKAISAYAMKTGRGRSAYLKICRPTGLEYAQFLKRHGGFHAIGEDCYISPWATIPDPDYVHLGNNVRISTCSIFGHDGSVNMINRAFGMSLDSVGKVEIRDNVFLAHGCIIQPGVTIGPNVIVSAGAVVNRDVEPGMIVAGVPAKPVGTVAMYAEMLGTRNQKYPWRHLIEKRAREFDPATEQELRRMRVAYFYARPPEPSKQGGES
jgi:acetyltransferase-like isoleucine patch superfamily enzyme